jgi:methionyl-tRNA formyltransferase
MSKKVVWLSANKLGYSLLKEAIHLNVVKIIAIVTLGDKSKTRMYDGIDKSEWYQFGIPVFEIEDINNEIKLLKKLSPDIIIACGWRQKINKDILKIPKRGIVGFHPTLLPKGRGPAPIINTILEGIRDSGVTMFYIDEGIDSGDIIGQEKFTVKESDYASDVYEKITTVAKALLKKHLPLLAKGKAPRTPQRHNNATYFRKISLRDNEIRPGVDNPELAYCKVRAFSQPYLGSFIRLGDKKLIIWKAQLRRGR